MIQNQADVASFRAAVRKAGLYTQWRASFGDEAWAVLERTVGIGSPEGTAGMRVTCCIAGGGPAGMMPGYLLARAGVEVAVLE